MNLTVNEDKTKCIILSRKNILKYSLRVKDMEFKRVDNLKHLSVEINVQGNNPK